jgi:phosphate transport system substrate-binding protein
MLIMLLGLAVLSSPAHSAEITGAGSTFVYPVLAKWADAYKKKTGTSVNYQSIGSGGGIKQIQNKTVDFGATDKPLTSEELAQDGLTQFPLVNGAVVPIVNLEGVSAGALKLSGEVLADIFLGKIAKWNDQAIASLNNGLKLPDQPITVVHRADGSGTTFIWTNYLSKVSPAWKEKAGEGTALTWPVGVGGKGNEGVAAFVKRLGGSIGYVEYAYALQNELAFARLKNKAGQFVSPDGRSFAAAAASADWEKAKDFHLVLTDAPGKKSWPIAGSTFVLLRKSQKDGKQAKELLNFFHWVFQNGGAAAEELHYVPLPKSVAGLVEKSWEQNVKDEAGNPIKR